MAAIGVVAAGLALAVAGSAAAANTPSGQTGTTTTKPSSTPGQADRTGGNGESPLTGDTAQKVRDAAQAAVPGGSVDRVSNETDGVSGAVYEAHATKADGTRVELQFDSDYKLLATNADRGRGGHRGGNGESPLTGDTAQKVKDAAQAAVPGGSVDRVSTETDGVSGAVYEAHATKADGTRVELQFDSAYKRLATNADNGPARKAG